MAEHIIFHDCSRQAKDGVQAYWLRKRDRVERLLRRFPEDQRHLRLTIKRRPAGYHARAVLLLPTGTLLASSDRPAHHYQQSLDALVERLTEAIRRHKEAVRREETDRRQRRRRRDLEEAAPLLAEHARTQDRAAFGELMQALRWTLRDHARHELAVAQLQGRTAPGELTVADVLDEVAARAWARFDRQPAGEPIDRWLFSLLHEVLDERLAEPPAMESLEQSIPPGDPRYEVAEGWTPDDEPYWPRARELTLEDALPGVEAAEPWQAAADRDEARWILDQLRALPLRRRRIFILHVLEGWDEHAIAMLLGCSPDDVRAEVAQARRTLRDSLGETVP